MVSKKTTPPADDVSIKARTLAAKTVPRRRNVRGISGDFDRYSIARNPARTRAPSPSGRIVSMDMKPAVAAFVNAYTTSISPLVTDRAPGRAKCWSTARPGLFARYFCERTAATVPIGTLTKSTDLQPKALVRMPPEMDPAAKPADSQETKEPSARFTSPPSGKVVTRIAKAVAVEIAAPIP